jgi:hypothetical protein
MTSVGQSISPLAPTADAPTGSLCNHAWRRRTVIHCLRSSFGNLAKFSLRDHERQRENQSLEPRIVKCGPNPSTMPP